MSQVSVPDPATTKGWPVGAMKTLRRSSIDSPKVLMNAGSTWDVAGVDIVPKTALSNSTGPGIIQSRCGGGAIEGIAGWTGVVGVPAIGDKLETDDSDPARLRPVVSLVNISLVALTFCPLIRR